MSTSLRERNSQNQMIADSGGNLTYPWNTWSNKTMGAKSLRTYTNLPQNCTEVSAEIRQPQTVITKCHDLKCLVYPTLYISRISGLKEKIINISVFLVFPSMFPLQSCQLASYLETKTYKWKFLLHKKCFISIGKLLIMLEMYGGLFTSYLIHVKGNYKIFTHLWTHCRCVND